MLTRMECAWVLRDEGRLSSEVEIAFAPSWMRVGWVERGALEGIPLV